jgi:hypothetical protein
MHFRQWKRREFAEFTRIQIHYLLAEVQGDHRCLLKVGIPAWTNELVDCYRSDDDSMCERL